MGGRNAPCRPVQSQRFQRGAPLAVGKSEQRAAVEVQQIEDRVEHRGRRRQTADRGRRGDVHPPLQRGEARAPLRVERDDLTVEHDLAHPEVGEDPANLGVGIGDLPQIPALEPQPARSRVRERANTIPLDLERPALLSLRQISRAREHRLDPFGHRHPCRVLRRIHPVDHPITLVLAGPADREQAVAAFESLAVEDHLDLLGIELDRLVHAPVPDPHRPGAVLPLWDLTLELQVLERVVLGVHRQPVLLRGRRNPVRDRPRHRDAFVLEPQVPVQPGGVVLLDDEPCRGRGGWPGRLHAVACGFGRDAEVTLGAVAIELVGHLR